ncbi:Brix domain [Carpediemonas membranifera]|uniref:Brix domain n=1 Tax=Carpediemonas membranifera TaxID=201153 RepID=A0A8J6E0A1_9EUKA|nr:Brix domain [Carpediemonas membranifera]|eukprot:KAG9391526.1 Brix domain [Carpediemonas membranifera]
MERASKGKGVKRTNKTPLIFTAEYADKMEKARSLKNSVRRSAVRANLVAEKKKEQQKARRTRNQLREKLGEEEVPKELPKTIDDMRVANDDAVLSDEEDIVLQDEYEDHREGKVPVVWVTTSPRPKGRRVLSFVEDLLTMIPAAKYVKRGKRTITAMCEYATEQGATDVVVVHADGADPTGIMVCHLPTGPTAWFKLDGIVLRKRIKNHGWPTVHPPEVIAKNFTTHLGKRVAQILGGLFPAQPDVTGRQVISINNKRDFIFMRFHRYEFASDEAVNLQELGPKFSLKLRYIVRGSFDPVGGEYEWNADQQGEQRRRFHL